MAGKSGAVRAGRAFVEIFADSTKLQAGLKSAGTQLQSFGARALKAGGAIAGLGAAAAVPLIAMVKEAGDAQETLSRFQAVFGDQADAAEQFAQSLSDATGRSKNELRSGLSSFQAFFKGLGFGNDEARAMSQQMSQLAIDFGSFNNLTDEDAIGRFLSGLSGSSEVFDKYGINLKAAALATEGVTSSSSEMEKVLARVAIIQKSMGTQGAIGDAIRTSASFANQTKRLMANLEELRIEIGNALLPIVNAVVTQFNQVLPPLVDWINANPKLVSTVGLVVTGAIALGAALAALGVAVAGIGIAVSALAPLFGALALPMMIAIGLIAALTAGFVTAGESIGDSWKKILKAVKSGDLMGALMAAKHAIVNSWTNLGFDLQAVFLEIEAAGKKTWATITAIAKGELNVLLNAWETAVFKIADMLTRLPGAEMVLGADPEAVREELRSMLGEKIKETSLDKKFAKIDADRAKAQQNLADARAEANAELKREMEQAGRDAKKATEDVISDSAKKKDVKDRVPKPGERRSLGGFRGGVLSRMIEANPMKGVEDKLDKLIEETKKMADEPSTLEAM